MAQPLCLPRWIRRRAKSSANVIAATEQPSSAKFLDTIDKAVPADLDVHVIMDNYGTHKTVMIRNWFARRPRFHAHFTPTSSSWINMVERFFAALTDKQIRRGIHRSTQQLEKAIREYLAIHNEAPKPFCWTKSADDILASVVRFCQRTSVTGH
jgi:transposase